MEFDYETVSHFLNIAFLAILSIQLTFLTYKLLFHRLVLLPVIAIPAGWLVLVGFRALVNVSADAINYLIQITQVDELKIVKNFIEKNAIQFTKTPSENAVLLAAILIVLVYGIVAITQGQKTTAIIKPASTTVTIEKKKNQ